MTLPDSKSPRRKHSGLRLVVLGLVLSATSIWACSVPVFRYALEKWPPDTYQAIVFHRGPLTEEQQSLARELSPDGLAGRLHANVSLHTVDLAQNPAPELLALWAQLGVQELPWLVGRYPLATRLPDNFVSTPLTETAVKQLLDSPARQEVVRRLGHGESAVWVLLEIGDPKRDDDAAKLVEARLSYLADVLKLPDIEAQDVSAGLVTLPEGGLKLAFSVLRVSRADAAETAFVEMLLGTEADLRDLMEPMLFPIFGQGRALYALAGKGINHETLDNAASFLVGKCSCEVKELNPGVDLLLAGNWPALVAAQADTTAVSPPGAMSSSELAPETVTINGGAGEVTGSSEMPRTVFTIWLLAAGLLAGGLLIGGVWLRSR